MDLNGLVPGEYVSAHVRAMYKQKRVPARIKEWTLNALNCTSNLRPGKPIFLASDTNYSAQVGIAYGDEKRANIVTHESKPNPPLHFDMISEHPTDIVKEHPPSDYYDTFIDLYLLALGGCVFNTQGGYGSWGLLIGGNVTCTWRQRIRKKRIDNPCEWKDPPTGTETQEARLTEPLFLEPMDY
jgi:hypothetical protein